MLPRRIPEAARRLAGQERPMRLAAALHFVAGCLMLVGAVEAEELGLATGGALMLVAWFCFATHANRLVRERTRGSLAGRPEVTR